MKIHPQARTAPQIRAEIRASPLSQREKTRYYNVTRATLRKWEKREDVQDRSHRPHNMATSLSAAQEAIVLEIRHLVQLPMEDLLVLIKTFMKPDMTYSSLSRLLKRNPIPSLRQLAREASAAGEEVPKPFKGYAPGFLHADIKYLPKMPDEMHRRDLFVAIDRATRWVFFKVDDDPSPKSRLDFLETLQEKFPATIGKILTDNGTQFTDRFLTSNKEASGKHPFDQLCARENIEHRIIPPHHPQTHGMAERMNGHIQEVLQPTRFHFANELETPLMRYLDLYNHHIPQRALEHQTPIQALKAWKSKTPHAMRFIIPAYDQARLDNRLHLDDSEPDRSPRLAAEKSGQGGEIMKYAVCNELFGALPLHEAVLMAARAGFHGLELAPFTLFGDFSSGDIGRGVAEARRALADNGLEFAGLHWLLAKPEGLRITALDPGLRRKSWDHLRRLVDAAGELGGGNLILGSPRQRCTEAGQTREQAAAILGDELLAIAPYAAERQSALLLEALSSDQTDVVNRLAEVEAIVEGIGSPGVGGMFDFHNCADEADSHEALIDRFFGMIGHVHLNNADGGHPQRGDLSFLPAFAKLRSRRYERWVSLEIFTQPSDPGAVLAETMDFLRDIERTLEFYRRKGRP